MARHARKRDPNLWFHVAEPYNLVVGLACVWLGTRTLVSEVLPLHAAALTNLGRPERIAVIWAWAIGVPLLATAVVYVCVVRPAPSRARSTKPRMPAVIGPGYVMVAAALCAVAQTVGFFAQVDAVYITFLIVVLPVCCGLHAANRYFWRRLRPVDIEFGDSDWVATAVFVAGTWWAITAPALDALTSPWAEFTDGAVGLVAVIILAAFVVKWSAYAAEWVTVERKAFPSAWALALSRPLARKRTAIQLALGFVAVLALVIPLISKAPGVILSVEAVLILLTLTVTPAVGAVVARWKMHRQQRRYGTQLVLVVSLPRNRRRRAVVGGRVSPRHSLTASRRHNTRQRTPTTSSQRSTSTQVGGDGFRSTHA